MKDPHGHGSNTHGGEGGSGSSLLAQLRARHPDSRILKGSKPVSDEEVAASLRTKHGPDPIHSAMEASGMDAVRSVRGGIVKRDWSADPIVINKRKF